MYAPLQVLLILFAQCLFGWFMVSRTIGLARAPFPEARGSYGRGPFSAHVSPSAPAPLPGMLDVASCVGILGRRSRRPRSSNMLS